MLTFSTEPQIWSFHVTVLERTAKKCTKTYNAHAERFFLLIKPIVLWRSRCRRRRRCLSSLLGGTDVREPQTATGSRFFPFLERFDAITFETSSHRQELFPSVVRSKNAPKIKHSNSRTSEFELPIYH